MAYAFQAKRFLGYPLSISRVLKPEKSESRLETNAETKGLLSVRYFKCDRIRRILQVGVPAWAGRVSKSNHRESSICPTQEIVPRTTPRMKLPSTAHRLILSLKNTCHPKSYGR